MYWLALACGVGCGGSRPSLDPPTVGSPNGLQTAASTRALLYVADTHGENVGVFAYENGKATRLVERLNGFSPLGTCADPNGNVYITAGSKIYEFAHGGAKPVRTLSDKFGVATGCAVDPATGNLAVADTYGPDSSPGNVLIWAKASGKPKVSYASNIPRPEYCTYDPSGNLFVDGSGESIDLALAELPRAAKKFVGITVSGVDFYSGGSIQWSAPYLLIAESRYRDKNRSAIYKFSISGSTATLAGTIVLERSNSIAQFWKQGSKIVAAVYGPKVPVYDFPSGDFYGDVKNGTYGSNAVVVSDTAPESTHIRSQ